MGLKSSVLVCAVRGISGLAFGHLGPNNASSHWRVGMGAVRVSTRWVLYKFDFPLWFCADSVRGHCYLHWLGCLVDDGHAVKVGPRPKRRRIRFGKNWELRARYGAPKVSCMIGSHRGYPSALLRAGFRFRQRKKRACRAQDDGDGDGAKEARANFWPACRHVILEPCRSCEISPPSARV